MSAWPLKADSTRTSRDFRFVPRRDQRHRSKGASLFDHIVGALLELQGNVETERFGGLAEI
jgi:hypothetical protein